MTRPQLYGVPALRGLVAVLPVHAHDVFYRDEIGNISTSNLRHGKRRVRNSAGVVLGRLAMQCFMPVPHGVGPTQSVALIHGPLSR